MPKVQFTNKGQATITIPEHLIRALGIKKGDEFLVQLNKAGNLELLKNMAGPTFPQPGRPVE